MNVTLLFLFILADGIYTRNAQSWAAFPRACMAACLVVYLLMWAWVTGIRLSPPGAIMAGIVAVMAVSNVYHTSYSGLDIATWLLYAAFYAVQRRAQRDWHYDFAIVGMAISMIVIMANIARLWPPPDGAWNRNVIGGILAACWPASMALVPSRDARRYVIMAIIAAGIILSGSRGAWLAGIAGLIVWMNVPNKWLFRLLPVGAALGGALFAMRLKTSVIRLVFMLYVPARMWYTSPVFGLGPSGIQVNSPVFWLGQQYTPASIHAHNTVISLAAMTGLLGVCLVAAAYILLARKRFSPQRYQLATLAAIATHSLVDDPLTWWPVGIIAAIAAAGDWIHE